MRKISIVPWILVALLAGCAEQPMAYDPVGAGYAVDQAAPELEQIRAEYEDCVDRLDREHPACRQLRWMYDDARQHLEDAARPTASQ